MLNNRQKALYEYLLEKSRTTNSYITKQVISTELSQLYPRYLETTTEGNSSAYRLLKKDIQSIKKDDETLMIISTRKGRGGYKLANKDEKLEQLDHELLQTLGKMKRIWVEKKKAEDNQQLSMEDVSIVEIVRYIGGKE